MPSYAVRKLSDTLKSQDLNLSELTVGVLGIAYKENIDDARRSPSADVAKLLVQKSNKAIIHDPFVNIKYMESIKGAEVAKSLDDLLNSCDVIFLATAHSVYIDKITPEICKKYNIKTVFDGRNALDKNKFNKSNVIYAGVGK